MQEYTIEKIVNMEHKDRNIFLSRNLKNSFGVSYSSVGNDTVLSEYGLCRADPENPIQNRTIEWYDENVLSPMIKNGKISDGSNSPFDDRKMRYHRGKFYGSTAIDPREICIFEFGHSHFLEYKEKRNRTKKKLRD